jgi:arginyl-tRNA--protein-N-Asp/Glu arginylyltransferase
MSYLNFGTKKLDPSDEKQLFDAYNEGYVLTRKEFGHMEKVRSLRVKLCDFHLSSENRRVLKKFNSNFKIKKIPFENYTWQIHKLGKDFYDIRFGRDTFSANKIYDIFNSIEKNNFNTVLEFTLPHDREISSGYCICIDIKGKALHYAYPFYSPELINSSFGIYMMTKTVEEFQKSCYDYIYLGSMHTPESKYKLQFKGLEWFDEISEKWSTDFKLLKERLNPPPKSQTL